MDWLTEKVEFHSILESAARFQLDETAFEALCYHLRRAKRDRIIDLAHGLLAAFPVMRIGDGSRLELFGARLALSSLIHAHTREHSDEIRRRIVFSMITIDAELDRLGAIEHRRIVSVWRTHFGAYSRALACILGVADRQPNVQLAALAEAVIIGAVSYRNHLEFILKMLDERISDGRKRRCKDRFVQGVCFGVSNPWNPTLSGDDFRHGMHSLLDEELPTSPPSELISKYTRVEFRGMRPIRIDERIGFLDSLLRNRHFKEAVGATSKMVAEW